MIRQNDLSNRCFRMTRGDGSLVAFPVFLLPDGRMFGTSHPNDSFWRIADDTVEILDPHRNVTTRLIGITRDAAGWRLAGPCILDATGQATIILQESAGAFDHTGIERVPLAKSVAVMVRTHMIDDRVLDLISHLDHGRQNFDLYLTIDETNGHPDTDFKNVVWHSLARCQELGLTQARDRLIWWCGDFPFYFALAQIPQYQYYAMIEYDVHLTQCDASLLNDVAGTLISREVGSIDAVGTRLRLEIPHNHPLNRSAYAFFETTYSYFFPFIVLSKPAVSYLYAQRQIEAQNGTPPDAILHCEPFVPSHLIRAGFNCVDLNALLPGSYRIDMMILRGRQHSMPRSLADGFAGLSRMIHPVYGDWQFLQRMLSLCRNDAQKQQLLWRVESGEFDQIPEPVRARLRAQVLE